MLESILNKLSEVSDRFYEIEGLLSKPDIINDQENYIALSKEYSDLKNIVPSAKEYIEFEKNRDDLNNIIQDKKNDSEMISLAEKELK